MTEQERLQYAAKAADIKLDKSKTNGGGTNNTGFDSMGNAVLDWHNNVIWNPRTSNQDSFNLMVKLELNVFHVNGCAYAMESIGDADEQCVRHGKDPVAAMREAIFRVAVALGKSMK